jgi:hypothetical protein
MVKRLMKGYMQLAVFLAVAWSGKKPLLAQAVLLWCILFGL